jgi:hypothetical protein
MFKTISWLKIVPAVFIIIAMAATVGCGEKSSSIPGAILINIRYGNNFIEFKLQNGNIIKTSEGEVTPIDKERRIPYSYGSEEFKNIYNKERLYYEGMEDKLAVIFSQYDLERLENLRLKLKTHDSLNTEKFLLTGPGKKFEFFTGKYTRYFLPNRQFSYVVFHRSFSSTGAMIDLNSKEISFPFGLDSLEKPVWNGKGQYLAYSTPNNDDRSQSILVIQDIDSDKNVLKKSIGKYVSDIAWSHDSKYVALLTYTGRIGLLPWDLLALMSGHPSYVSWFYLEVYDLSGNLILYKKVNGSFKEFSGHSRGRLVWIP